jgi:hypothetical protein
MAQDYRRGLINQQAGRHHLQIPCRRGIRLQTASRRPIRKPGMATARARLTETMDLPALAAGDGDEAPSAI